MRFTSSSDWRSQAQERLWRAWQEFFLAEAAHRSAPVMNIHRDPTWFLQFKVAEPLKVSLITNLKRSDLPNVFSTCRCGTNLESKVRQYHCINWVSARTYRWTVPLFCILSDDRSDGNPGVWNRICGAWWVNWRSQHFFNLGDLWSWSSSQEAQTKAQILPVFSILCNSG